MSINSQQRFISYVKLFYLFCVKKISSKEKLLYKNKPKQQQQEKPKNKLKIKPKTKKVLFR